MTDHDARRRLLADEDDTEDLDAVDTPDAQSSRAPDYTETSDVDYKIATAFAIMGAAMLWPFNAFITANEFFGRMFRDNAQILQIYSLSITSVFTVTNLMSTVYFTRTVRKADLNARVSSAALSTTALLALLAVLTTASLKAVAYFVILLTIVATVGITTGGLQNGCFGLVGAYGPRYVQFIFIGQGIAGVTPALLSIAVALIDRDPAKSANRRAFAYFLSSSLVLASSYFAHLYLKSRLDQDSTPALSDDSDKEPELSRYKKFLRSYHSWTIFLIFVVTLSIFPSITASVTSVRDGKSAPKWLQPAVYIPLGFLLWNTGDLLGRIISALPAVTIEDPRLLFTASVLRILWIPMVYLCNVRGHGAILKSDAFFLVFMLLFGTSNGFVSSLTFAAAIKQARDDEKRDIGAFMTFMLCSGLVVGSILSFVF
ncbi:Nucleoside transporter family [Taphrina deformans PYCC 5710]|uniref:Nucleoside transporter family n=1 Tax=Taphrina deformans (strain PYCC 5710 / ATCC 11124 / CBS 356.35 / IMI 108563 / JCM 9778 / NBRC 8474) TaxID=1097556 RepID=R4XG23_TAPDE|nr:Nucleoside transporter family [Taphrina deformans PYCC 5710]|eukprot:CCG82334.1 Nucleoside transporter family [Taphrina deformans PYCC 5710]